MKKIYSFLVIMIIAVTGMAQGIKFEHIPLEVALNKVKKENKVLFIDGYATWCGPCKKMDKTVFVDEEVGHLFDEKFVALKVDVERGEGPMIKRKYGISGLPGYVFVDQDDQVIYRFSSAMPKEMFIEQVELALSYLKDPNSIGRLAERYEKEKNNAEFVRLYLDKLKEYNSVNYTDILEQYLTIQTSVKESSKEMVTLLADHYTEIIFNSKADEIIQRNFGSDEWKLYVRKDIREIFQKLPKSMVEKTTAYAIAKKDTAFIELAIERAGEAGVVVDDAQRKRIYKYYYFSVGEGEKYKQMVYPENEAFVQSINIEELRYYYLDWLERKAAGDEKAQYSRPYAVKKSQEITMMVNDFAKFVKTDQEKADVVRWMKVAYDIKPDDALNMSHYANILYMFSDHKTEAIDIKTKAYEKALKEGNKRSSGMKTDLELMKSGEEVTLTY